MTRQQKEMGLSYDWDRKLLLAMKIIINGLNGSLNYSIKKA